MRVSDGGGGGARGARDRAATSPPGSRARTCGDDDLERDEDLRRERVRERADEPRREHPDGRVRREHRAAHLAGDVAPERLREVVQELHLVHAVVELLLQLPVLQHAARELRVEVPRLEPHRGGLHVVAVLLRLGAQAADHLEDGAQDVRVHEQAGEDDEQHEHALERALRVHLRREARGGAHAPHEDVQVVLEEAPEAAARAAEEVAHVHRHVRVLPPGRHARRGGGAAVVYPVHLAPWKVLEPRGAPPQAAGCASRRGGGRSGEGSASAHGRRWATLGHARARAP